MAAPKGHFVVSVASNWIVPGSGNGDLVLAVSNSNQSILLGSSNNSTNLKFSSNGNIGIGLINPSKQLDVNGVLKTNSIIRVPDLFINSMPFLAYRRVAAQTIGNSPNPNPAVLFDVLESSRGDHGLTYTSATGIFTNTSGSARTYRICYSLTWTTINSTGSRAVYIMLNGSLTPLTRFALTNMPGSTNVTTNSSSCILTLNNNDYISLNVWQNSGSSLNVGSDSYNCSLIQIQRL